MTSLAELTNRAAELAGTGERRILGITGPPGAGKTRLAERIVDGLGADRAALVGMDGFHLADAELVRIGLRERKGAPETFDAGGYAALLRRIVAGEDVWAPASRGAQAAASTQNVIRAS